VALPSRVPVSLLHAAGAVISFRLPDPDDAKHVAAVMGLQDEDISGKRRHASYQGQYLQDMGRVGSHPWPVAVARRRDVPKAFMLLADACHERSTGVYHAGPSFDAEPLRARDGTELPLESRLRDLGPAWPAVLRILHNLGQIGGIGTKKEDLLRFVSAELLKDGLARAPARAGAGVAGTARASMEAEARQRASAFVTRMASAGYLVVTSASTTGLQDDVMVKLASGAKVLVDQAMARAGVATGGGRAGHAVTTRGGEPA